MRVQEHDSVCLVRGHESCQLAVCAWAELVRSIAVRSAVFRHCLKIRRSGTAAAMANQYDFRDPGLASEESHSCPYVEGNELPIHGRFVVLESRVHTQNAEAPPWQFLGRHMRKEVAGPMNGQECNVRYRTTAWNPIQPLTSTRKLRELFHHRCLCKSL